MAAAKKTYISFEDSLPMSDRHYRFVFHGASKIGKTFLALTASEHFPDVLPTNPPVVLKDMAWWSFDNGALRGAKEQGLSVPHVMVLLVSMFDCIVEGLYFVL